MSNSPLVTYTRISPNRNSPRNHEIDTITIHGTMGEGTAEDILSLSKFVNYNPNEGASVNYAVGYDGSIGLGVPESDRAWTSNSKSNDNRAITIEVSCKHYAPYVVTDAAYNALINLLVDICQRNNIPKLLWKDDSSLIGQVDKQNMTLHRWFAATNCPGDYLYNLHPEIASTVNARLGASDSPLTYSGNRFLTEAEMQVNARFIYRYLTTKGWSVNAISGVLGNMEHESSINPGIWQGLNEGNTSGGFGLVQWTPATRHISWCEERGYDPAQMESNLEHLNWEINNGDDYYPTSGYPMSFAEFVKSTEDPYYLACAFAWNYERSAVVLWGTEEQQEALRQQRGNSAKKWYNYLCGCTPDTPDTPDTPPEPTYKPQKMSFLLLLLSTGRRG